jgi:hypothetical protein
MNNQAPFLDVSSFITEEQNPDVIGSETSTPLSSPFLSLYESEEPGGLIDPETEDYVTFLNEIYNEEFDEAVANLMDEASVIFETQFQHEQEDPRTISYQAERLLAQHFAPLVAEAEAMFGTLAGEFSRRDPNTLSENEIETIVDRYQHANELTPNFEEFLGKLKKAVKKVAQKGVDLAKKGVSAAAKLGLGPIFEKLKALINPLLKRVIQTAIGKLPPHLQPIARKLAERLPFLKEFEESYESTVQTAETCEVAEIQYEFNQEVANILFAHTEVEQDLEIARALTEQPIPDTYSLAELDHARQRLVENLQRLKDGEDPAPYIENFIPAILPALRMGIRLAGRKRIVNFLAGLLSKLIQKFVGPQHTPALSQAIVDAGLRLIQLETTPEDKSEAAASAVVATIEETVQKVAALPDYILEDQELIKGFALEAFEQAATANFPPILPEETYIKRPELREAGKLKGTWIMMPRGMRKRYKKFSRKIPTSLTPHRVSAIETFEGIPLEEFLEEELGLASGEEFEAIVHLYEGISGTRLSNIARLEENLPGLGTANGRHLLHPLTQKAAALLLREPGLGRDLDSQHHREPHNPTAGERFYYLEIPGKRLLSTAEPSGNTKTRRPTKVRLILDFPGNEIRVHLFLSEIRAQEVAVKLRRHSHTGIIVARLGRILERGLRKALDGGFGRLKIIHEAVTPSQWSSAIRRLPSLVPQVLMGRLQEWILKGLANHLKKQPEEFIKAAEDTADGVTMMITFSNPPGFPQLRQALKGKGLSPAILKMSNSPPEVKIKIIPGYNHE